MFSAKKVFSTPVILLISGIIAGLLLLFKPGATLDAVIKIVCWAVIIDAAVKAVQLFLNGNRKTDAYVFPVIQVIIGVGLMIAAHLLLRIIPIIIGLGLIALGGYKIKTALMVKGKAASDKSWIVMIVFAAVSIIVGIYILSHPAGLTNTLIRILGVYLLIECAEDLYAYYLMK